MDLNEVLKNKAIRIGMLCDMHLCEDTTAPQYAFLQAALDKMHEDGIERVICLGDITSFGEMGAWNNYQELVEDFKHEELLGNCEVRDNNTAGIFCNMVKPVCLKVGSRTIIGIHTPYGKLTAEDRALLQKTRDGDVILMHHYPESLEEDSRKWLTELMESKSLIMFHGHRHVFEERYIGKSRVYGFKGLDPDKAIGGFPALAYVGISDDRVEIMEHAIRVPTEALWDVRKYFGISCVDNVRDVLYATEHHVTHIELRCNGDWKPDDTLLPLLEEWRTKTKGYLSVHMPNLKYADGVFTGGEQWHQALKYAIDIKADGLTMHPPRVSIGEMLPDSPVWNTFLSFYLEAAESVPERVKLGIENLHKGKKEKLDENRGFGYTPEEVSLWIDTLNERIGHERIGHVLDVGHTRNNGAYSKKYPVSRWYQLMGRKTVAYHIHQVVQEEDGLKNHRPIESWFGPMINYTSFFYAWQKGMLNHMPVFLEVRGCHNYEKSMQGLERIDKECI